METLKTILERRSIRQFQDKEVSREIIEKILEVTLQAPSGKNLQPWHFVVIEGEKKNALMLLISNSLKTLKEKGINTGTAKNTFKIMEQAPVLIFVFNKNGTRENDDNTFSRYLWLVDIQSIGGAIQTMLLAAHDIGLGSLWICDVFYTDSEICSFLNQTGELIAAVAIGYPNETPLARPRKKLSEISEFQSS